MDNFVNETRPMAIKAATLKAWLATVSDDDTVVINTGEMSVETTSGDSHCTVGGKEAVSSTDEAPPPPDTA